MFYRGCVDLVLLDAEFVEKLIVALYLLEAHNLALHFFGDGAGLDAHLGLEGGVHLLGFGHGDGSHGFFAAYLGAGFLALLDLLGNSAHILINLSIPLLSLRRITRLLPIHHRLRKYLGFNSTPLEHENINLLLSRLNKLIVLHDPLLVCLEGLLFEGLTAFDLLLLLQMEGVVHHVPLDDLVHAKPVIEFEDLFSLFSFRVR